MFIISFHQNILKLLLRTVLREINQSKTKLVDFDDPKSKEERKEKVLENNQSIEDCQNRNTVVKVEKLLSFSSFKQETYL